MEIRPIDYRGDETSRLLRLRELAWESRNGGITSDEMIEMRRLERECETGEEREQRAERERFERRISEMETR